MEGTLGSIKGVASRIGSALGGGAMGVALSLVAYDPNNITPAALTAIRMIGQHRAAGALHRHHHPHGRLRSGQAHA